MTKDKQGKNEENKEESTNKDSYWTTRSTGKTGGLAD